MIYYLVGDSAIEKSTVFTSLYILNPKGVKLVNNLPISELPELKTTKGKSAESVEVTESPASCVTVVLKSPVDIHDLDSTANQKKLKKLIKQGDVALVRFPDLQQIPEAKTQETLKLQTLGIPMVESLMVFTTKSEMAVMADTFGAMLEQHGAII